MTAPAGPQRYVRRPVEVEAWQVTEAEVRAEFAKLGYEEGWQVATCSEMDEAVPKRSDFARSTNGVCEYRDSTGWLVAVRITEPSRRCIHMIRTGAATELHDAGHL